MLLDYFYFYLSTNAGYFDHLWVGLIVVSCKTDWFYEAISPFPLVLIIVIIIIIDYSLRFWYSRFDSLARWELVLTSMCSPWAWATCRVSLNIIRTRERRFWRTPEGFFPLWSCDLCFSFCCVQNLKCYVIRVTIFENIRRCCCDRSGDCRREPVECKYGVVIRSMHSLARASISASKLRNSLRRYCLINAGDIRIAVFKSFHIDGCLVVTRRVSVTCTALIKNPVMQSDLVVKWCDSSTATSARALWADVATLSIEIHLLPITRWFEIRYWCAVRIEFIEIEKVPGQTNEMDPEFAPLRIWQCINEINPTPCIAQYRVYTWI